MAKTISGCVDRATGEILFAGEACDESDYTGCIERTGAHAGQVAVTIEERNCYEDTYYGCVNRVTGEFDVSIPDDCCNCSCPCDDYPPWDADRTYLTGDPVKYISTCYVSLQDANTGHTPSTSPTWWDVVPCHCCPAEYSDYDCAACCCFDAGETPLYLCATFSGMKLCSDDSTIPTFSLCCVQGGSSQPENERWYAPCVIDGDSCIVMIDFSGISYDSFVTITSATKLYYMGISADFCRQPMSVLVKTGEYYEFYCGLEIGLGIVSAYGGAVSLCDPHTGDFPSPC